MKKKNIKNKVRKETTVLPKWVKSYHLLLIALLILLIFGAVMRYINLLI